LKIVADENIPYVREAFAGLGEVVTAQGRSMTAETVKDADLLMVRSVTKVNRDLLDGSKVRFVATATIGEDHLDKVYLQEKGVVYASAPGSNANSVAEYITSALLRLANHFEFELAGKTLGIVGVGNVGSRVAKKAEALGMRCVLNDPPLANATGDPKYRPIGEIYNCDIVTFHVPLIKEGSHPTYHMADDAFLHFLNRGAIVLNSSRGAVVNNKALAKALDDGHIKAAVLDVWEGEPAIDTGLLERVFLGTPHIAGYSFDGKVNGTRQIYEAACKFLGVEADWDPAPLLPKPEEPVVTVDGSLESVQEAVSRAVFAVYDIRRDDAALRETYRMSPSERPAWFDRLRKEYPRRREFYNFTARIWPPNHAVHERLSALGFQCKDE
jgi:erythronate-4-phosphate dehydrogenase